MLVPDGFLGDGIQAGEKREQFLRAFGSLSWIRLTKQMLPRSVHSHFLCEGHTKQLHNCWKMVTLSPPCHPLALSLFSPAVYVMWIGFLKRNESFDFFSYFSPEGMHRKEALDMFSYKWVFLLQVFFSCLPNRNGVQGMPCVPRSLLLSSKTAPKLHEHE